MSIKRIVLWLMALIIIGSQLIACAPEYVNIGEASETERQIEAQHATPTESEEDDGYVHIATPEPTPTPTPNPPFM